MIFDPLHLLSEFPKAAWLVGAPGRVNLLGEHVDYNGGMVLPMAIDRRVWLAARPRADRVIHLSAADMHAQVSFDLDHVHERVDVDGMPLPDWALFPAGVAWALLVEGYTLRGFDGVYRSDLPIGAGLSSSAAVELAFAVLFQSLSGWSMERMRMAQICQRAENTYVGVNSGLMDQFASAHGVGGHALYFDTLLLEWQPFPLPYGCSVVVADSDVRRTLASSAYNQRRSECELALQMLERSLPGIKTLREVSLADFNRLSPQLPAEIAMRARHVIEEIERVRQACQALHEDDAPAFGRLMLAGHASLRDLYQVSCPELDALVEIAAIQPGCYGARLTGAGFGGCTVNLVKTELAEDFINTLSEEFKKRCSKEARAFVCQPSRGAFAQPVKS